MPRAAFLLVVAAVAGCGGWGPTESGDGAEVFKGVCANCHGADGKPDSGTVARIHPRDFTSPEFRARVTQDLVVKQVRNGSDNKLMPAFQGVLRDAQIDAVSAYVVSRFGK